ncbi:putative Zn(II)2Cys6 transcription factor [Tothia fuscella]|uniref:Zn(II)2Cys6 transcription factor n=1 Tax=Tothia fuscella TaxID=1048955 RepID=A0A9P4NTE8_9PEZI|nr:putative Zn(II)2Cys6 transcription factor [Tothia fuscella]
MTVHPEGNVPKRRKVRKGTHSCWECRRRKVKCIFASDEDVVCVTCRRRGTSCASQSERTRFMLMTPELPPTPASCHNFTAEPDTNSKITQALLNSLPPRTDIELLLVKTRKISMVSYRSCYKSRTAIIETSKEHMLEANLLSPYSHPVLLARQMLLFATTLQYLDPNEAIPGLTKHYHLIMEQIAESVIAHVTTNDGLLGTLEGLENITLEGRYHVDSGNIRRAWITMRRAVMAAQLLGLHRPGHYRFKIISDKNDMIPESLWASIVSMERGLSLLLGLPTSTGDKSCDMQATANGHNQAHNFALLTTAVTAKILERNQIHPSQQALDMTRELDRELVKMTEQMPPSFWRPPMFVDLEIDSVDAILEAGRNWDHMWYYSLVNQLHLPYMMCPTNITPQSLYSRVACVNASREILNREIANRSFSPITANCRIGDFVALIAGMTLMLAHIVSHCRTEENNMLVHQRLSDRATVEQALECMKSMSELGKDALTAKCAALLKRLLAVEADAAQGHSQRDVLLIQVPYIGTIRIAPEGISFLSSSKVAQERDLPEGVTIGGIGSLHLNRSIPPESNVTHSTGIATDTQHSTHVTQLSPGDIYMQQDQMFPDAAAGMDDWVFQGFDTAFFDVIMRGVEDQQQGGATAEVWGI